MNAQPLCVAPSAEVRINKELHVVREVSPKGQVILEYPIRRTRLSYAMPELVAMHMAGTLLPLNNRSTSHKGIGTPKLGVLEPAASERIARRLAYGKAATQEFRVGPKSPRMKLLIDAVAQRIGDTNPPSPHSVYLWVRRYVTAGYDTAVFMRDVDMTRTRRPRGLTDDLQDLLNQDIYIRFGAFRGANHRGISNIALARTAKYMGYVSFLTREGSEEPVDRFITC